MKICTVCLKSDMLCSGCGKRLEKNMISETDIALSRALFKLGFDAEFLKSIDCDGYVVVLADRKNSGLMIGKGGRNAKRLSLMLSKDVRIIQNVQDEKKLMETVISAPILGINKIYGKTEMYKLRIERRFKNRVEALSPLVSKVVNKEVRMVFE